MPKYLTIGIKRADGDAVVLKETSVAPSVQRDYVCGLGSYDPTYKEILILDLDEAVKKAAFSASIACTVTAADKSIVYGANKPSFSSTFSASGGDTYSGTLSYACTYAKGSAAGTYAITPSGITSDLYSYEFEAGTLTVTKKALTLTATDKSITAGDNAPGYAFTGSGYITGDDETDLGGTASYTVKDSGGNVVSDVSTAAAGSYRIILAGLTSDNYDITFEEGTLTIS